MTDIRALAERAIARAERPDRALPDTYQHKERQDAATLARAVLRLLEAGDKGYLAVQKLVYFAKPTNEQPLHSVVCNAPRNEGFGNGRCNCGVADGLTFIAAWDAAVRGEGGG